MITFEQRIADALDALVPPMSTAPAAKFAALLAELERWNRKVNLTAIRDPDEMIGGHLIDSLVALPLIQGRQILDVGTGAGFPGLPLAIVAPEREFELIDSNNKKIMFVQHVVGLLGLDNVKAIKARSEDYAPGHRFDTVIARAVSSVPGLLQIAGGHVREDGVFVALKGRHPAEELEDIPPKWGYEVKELAVPGLRKGSRHAVVLRQTAEPCGRH